MKSTVLMATTTFEQPEFSLTIEGEWEQVEGEMPGDLHLNRKKRPPVSIDITSRPQRLARSRLAAQLDAMLEVGELASALGALQGWKRQPPERTSGEHWERSISRRSNDKSGGRFREVFVLTTRKVVKLCLLTHAHDDAGADAFLEQLLAGLQLRLP